MKRFLWGLIVGGFFLVLIGIPVALTLGLTYLSGGKVGSADVYNAIYFVGTLGGVSGVMAALAMED